MSQTVRIDLQLSERQLDWLKQEAAEWNADYGDDSGFHFGWRNVLIGICLSALNSNIDSRPQKHDSHCAEHGH